MVIMSNIIKSWFIVRIILKDKASAIQILTSHMRIKVGLHYPTFIKNHYQLFICFSNLPCIAHTSLDELIRVDNYAKR